MSTTLVPPANLLFRVEQAATVGSSLRWHAQLNGSVRDVIRPRLEQTP